MELGLRFRDIYVHMYIIVYICGEGWGGAV